MGDETQEAEQIIENLDRLVEELKEFDYDKLESTIETCDYDELEKVYLDISSLEKLAEESSSLKDTQGRYIGKFVDRIQEIEKKFDGSINDIYHQLTIYFENKTALLESAPAPEIASKYRAETDKIYSDLEKMIGVAKKRKIPLDKSKTKKVKKYGETKKKIEKIDLEYDRLVSDYQSIEKKDVKKKVKKLSKSVKGGFFTKGLFSKAKKYDYLEGIEKISSLSKEMDFIKNNYNDIFLEKANLMRSIDFTNSEISRIQSIPNTEIPYKVAAKLKVLSKTQSDSDKWSNKLYLSNLVKEYSDKCSLLKNVASEFLAKNPKIVKEYDLEEKNEIPFELYLSPKVKSSSGPLFYSMKFGMNMLCYPDNVNYYKISNILSGKNGEISMNKIFDNFIDELADLRITNKSDANYLKDVSNVLNKAIQKPLPDFPVQKAKAAHEVLNYKLRNYV